MARSRTWNRPVIRVERRPDLTVPKRWPATIPAVAQLLDKGLDVPAGVTFLVGENGSGKSTVVEALAEAYGLNPEGGSRHARHSTRRSESELAGWLTLKRGVAGGTWSYFLRAETMHGLYTYLENLPDSRERDLHERSHGESFLTVFERHLDTPGFYLMDEPEAALSFRSCLALLALLHDLAGSGSQIVVATHSPILAALPGATIIELGEHGLRRTTWDELSLVEDWRAFLDEPAAYLRHLLTGPDQQA